MAGRIGIGIAFAVVVYGGMVLWGGWRDVAHALAGFHYAYLLLALGLAFANFTLRGFRWKWLLARVGVHVPHKENLLISYAGLSLAITPGKVGEALKSYLLLGRGFPVVKTLPAVFVERICDLLGVIALAATGIFAYREGVGIVLLALVITVVIAWLSTSRRASELVFSLGERIPRLRPRVTWLRDLVENIRGLFRPGTLVVAGLIGCLAWFCEAAALYFVLLGAGAGVNLFVANFMYSLSTLAGVVFPGGIGGTEGVLTLMLLRRGLAKDTALAAVLLFRLSTLWWATAVGVVALLVVSRGAVGSLLPDLERESG